MAARLIGNNWTRPLRELRLTIASVALAASAGAALAQSSVAEIANLKGPERQTKLETIAQREGQVVVYSNGAQNNVLIDDFRKRYPAVRVIENHGESAELTRKSAEEFNAKRYDADIYELTAEGLFQLADMGVLQSFFTPEVAAYASEAIGRNGLWIGMREGLLGIGFNSSRISPDEAPKGNRDLLDPKWRGRMAMTNSTATTIRWVGSLALSEGEDFVRKLGQQNIRVYSASGRAVANLMISGEVDLSPTIFLSHVETSSAEGAPLVWRPSALVPVNDTSIALAAHAPHPAAAMLYIDFMLSREAQIVSRKQGYLSSRNDVPVGAYPPMKKLYMANRPDYVREFEGWSRLYQDVFLKGAPLAKQ